MGNFEAAYKALNSAQKQAVDTIDGPVLVVAGPGTGKTQLLSARVAYILKQTDTAPQNILCLTFTESGAAVMRERLATFIGKAAYDVQIGTYHSFGADLIRRFPQYFGETRLERPVDELAKRQLLSAIVESLSYQNPLKQTRHHLGDLISTISEVKRGLLSPKRLRDIATTNLHVIDTVSGIIRETLAEHTKRLPTKLAVAEPLFSHLQTNLATLGQSGHQFSFKNLAQLASEELATALDQASEVSKTTPLTTWKNKWLAKDTDNNFVLAGRLEAERMQALAAVLQTYEAALADRGLYDFDDMILRAINALEQHNDFRYSLQEQYQYLLLDEFQDTNAAQLRLVELLTNNPVNEGRPNVLAVGDDDQAIYAFQGAQYSNMLDYVRLYRDVLVINLSQNYRSTSEILLTAKNISAQITDTLRTNLPALDKALVASNQSLPKTVLKRTEYASDVAELAGVSKQIKQLVASGIKPSDIAVLAPKHRYLETLVPYLEDVPVRYERRENILDVPIIQQLLTMSKLVLALHNRYQALADSLWPEVLSYDFWDFPVSDIWQLSWNSNTVRKPWSELLLANEQFRPAALLFLSLAAQIETETLEVVLDRLLGTEEVETRQTDIPRIRSPLRAWLTGQRKDAHLYEVISHLRVLRTRLREHQLSQAVTLHLPDLLAFIDEYRAAEEQMLDTSPYSEAADAVQLLTVFKAKGLEFTHVFLLSCQDEVWGNSSRGNSNKLTLPANLAPIRHAGASEDERLRIFFVAVTRAKYGLYLSSHRMNYGGKKSLRLKYLAEIEQPDGRIDSQVLPTEATFVETSNDIPSVTDLQTGWQRRHTLITPPLKELLASQLQRYQLSPTHLTSFIDLEHAGPEAFLLHTLLRFPIAPSVDIVFGNTMHETMEWLQLQVNQHTLPTIKATVAYFTTRLQLQPLTPEQQTVQLQRGRAALQLLIESAHLYFKAGNLPEYNFRNEGVVLGEVKLGGKIDLLEIDHTHKVISVVDYKTGRLGSDPAKLHRYELQLYCYKLLIEGSHSFKGYQVEQGRLLFVEPDNTDTLTEHSITYTPEETTRVTQLLAAMWQHVQNLTMPDISAYGSSLKAIKQFEQDLIDGTI